MITYDASCYIIYIYIYMYICIYIYIYYIIMYIYIYIFDFVINWCTIWWLLCHSPYTAKFNTWKVSSKKSQLNHLTIGKVRRWRSTLIQFPDGTSSSTSWIRPLKSLAASDSPWPGRPGRAGSLWCCSYLYRSVAVHKPWMPRIAKCQNF